MSPAPARHELLAEPDDVVAAAADDQVLVIDCGYAGAHYRAHIPGAIHLPWHPYLKDPEDPDGDPDRWGLHVIGAERFAALVGSIGIGDDTRVIAYDDRDGLWATRFWWVMAHYGAAERVRVLDGGWRRWVAEERSVSTVAPASRPAATFTPRVDEAWIARIEDLRPRVEAGEVQILDTRSDEEWTGAGARGNARTGHLPGAVHHEWTRAMADDGRFRAADDLRETLTGLGLDPARPVASHCQAGIRAAHGVFVLALAGFERVANYDASMKEWANRGDTPLVT